MNEPKQNTDPSQMTSDRVTAATPVSDAPKTVPEADTSTLETESVPATMSGIGSSGEEKSGNVVRDYVLASIVVILIMGGLWYMLEREDRVATNIFTPNTAATQVAAVAGVAATVNGVEITNQSVASSVETLALQAQAQGVDVTNPLFQEQLTTQALETLVNTELLRQAVADAAIEVSAEEVDTRIAQIAQQLGSDEELVARLSEANLTIEDLRNDIKDEIGIQALLSAQIEPELTEVTEEDMRALYEEFGGEEAGLPPFEDVQTQLEAELIANQQQTLVLAYIETLKDSADIAITEASE